MVRRSRDRKRMRRRSSVVTRRRLNSGASPQSNPFWVEETMPKLEDLLFAIEERRSARLEKAWKARFPKLILTRIGTLKSVSRKPALPRGYDHFAKR